MLRLVPVGVALSLVLSASARADVVLVTNAADAGAGSLRAALTTATAGDQIHFAIPPGSLAPIQPQTALPALAGGVSIDGTTQAGASCAAWPPTLLIELDGSDLPPAMPVLFASGNEVSIRGLVVHSGPGHGIRLLDATGAALECNFVGTDASGTQARPNNGDGVSLGHAIGTDIGGLDPTQANVISGNGQSGIRIDGESLGTDVFGNYIGTDPTDTSLLGNGGAGVDVFNGASNRIGASGAPNRIRGNGGGAVVVSGASALGNTIRFNSISDNGAHGIDLLGLPLEDPNDPLDADEGPNRLQNWPVISSAGYAAGSQLTVTFSVPTDPANAAYPLAIDFYVADALDEEGEIYLGTLDYTAADFASGAVTRSLTAQGSVQIGDSIVATATDIGGIGNTSEFADQFAVVPEADGLAGGIAAIGVLARVAWGKRRRGSYA
jgi:hypothetical protein